MPRIQSTAHPIGHLVAGFCALVALSVLNSPSAEATVMRYADMARLVEISDVIVHGEILDRSTHRDDDALWTTTTVEIHRTFRGEHRPQRMIHQWGGEYQGQRAQIPGDPRLEPGQEVVLFLRRDEHRQGLTLSALAQSVFEIRSVDGQLVAHRDLHDLSFVTTGDGGARIVTYRDPPRQWSTFVDILEALLQSPEETR